MPNHPNATAAAIAGAITVLLVYAAGFAGIDPPGEVSSAVTTLLVTLILFLGGRKAST